MEIVLLTKETEYCRIVEEYVKKKVPNTMVFSGDTTDPFPQELDSIDLAKYYVISFLSPWLVPEWVLDRAKASINFHPASRNYPGSGCYNFAIYNREKEYGATCHHMLKKADTGKVIKEIRFPMYEHDTVFTLKNRTMDHLMILFYDVFDYLLENEELPAAEQEWLRKPYMYIQFRELCRLTKEMDDEEISRRIRATYYPGARDLPYIELAGEDFVLMKRSD